MGEEFKPHVATWGATNKQLWKIRKLAEEIGWDDPRRLNGMIKNKFYGKDRPELLNKIEASKLIIALEKMNKEVEAGEKTYA